MYKNLNCDLLGISGRQSEIIELALTYGFRGIDIDMDDLVKRCQRGSFESASRFLVSSKLKIGGFEAPIDLDCDEDTFTTKAAQLNGVAEIARRAAATTAMVTVPYATNRLPYPEYFDVIRKRIDMIAETFGKEEVRLAVAFEAQNPDSEEKEFKFLRDVEGFSALIRACTSKNVAIVYDTWNWYIGGGDEAALDQLGLDRIAAVHIADCREGVDAKSATRDDCLLPSSTGVIDNESILRRLQEAGMKLPVSAMGRPEEAGSTRDALVALTQDALDKTFEAAGLPSQTRKPEMFAETSYARNY